MNSDYKGKAPMEHKDSEQLIKDFEDIMININEYCEAVNEKAKLFKEIFVDLRADLEKLVKSRLISIRLLKNSKRTFPRSTVKKSELNFLNYLFVLKIAREILQTPSLKKRKRSMN